jgi:hypothetical protein
MAGGIKLKRALNYTATSPTPRTLCVILSMKCSLCDREEKQIKADAIPEFLYDGMFIEHHRIAIFILDI